MPNLYLAEYIDLGAAGRGVTPFPQEPPIGEQTLDISARSVASDALLDETCIVRLVSDVDCAIAIGTSPDASDSVRFVLAGKEQLLSVVAGSRMKLAVIATGGSVGNGYDTLGNLLHVVASPAEVQKQLDALAGQASKAAAATLDLRTANQETIEARDALATATATAKKERADADAALAGLADLKAQLDKRAAELDDRSRAFDADAAVRKYDLDKRAADLIEGAKTLDAAKKDLQDTGADLAKREADLATKSAAVDSLAADYDAKLAKLRALTS